MNKRNVCFNEKHCPEYLCLTFIAVGGMTHYYHLYNRNKIAPKVLCVENPGWEGGLGMYNENGVFKDTILMNERGMPLFLMGPDFFPLTNYYENITQIVTNSNHYIRPQLRKLRQKQ